MHSSQLAGSRLWLQPPAHITLVTAGLQVLSGYDLGQNNSWSRQMCFVLLPNHFSPPPALSRDNFWTSTPTKLSRSKEYFLIYTVGTANICIAHLSALKRRRVEKNRAASLIMGSKCKNTAPQKAAPSCLAAAAAAAAKTLSSFLHSHFFFHHNIPHIFTGSWNSC